MAERCRFRAGQRLARQRDFERVFARRCTAGDGLLVVYADENGLDFSRLGLKVSKRLGGAVTRSRIRRLLREAFRTQQHSLPQGLDVICIPQAGQATSFSVEAFGKSLQQLMARAQARLDRSKSSKG